MQQFVQLLSKGMNFLVQGKAVRFMRYRFIESVLTRVVLVVAAVLTRLFSCKGLPELDYFVAKCLSVILHGFPTSTHNKNTPGQ